MFATQEQKNTTYKKISELVDKHLINTYDAIDYAVRLESYEHGHLIVGRVAELHSKRISHEVL